MAITKEKELVNEMLDLLQEVNDLNGEHIDDSNYYKFYEEAADELERFEEDEEGEGDIYRFTYEYLDEYCELRHQLVELLKAKGLTLEERKAFYKKELCWEE